MLVALRGVWALEGEGGEERGVGGRTVYVGLEGHLAGCEARCGCRRGRARARGCGGLGCGGVRKQWLGGEGGGDGLWVFFGSWSFIGSCAML